MNGNNNDTNYRYTMPKVITKISGKGNGIYTIFSNIEAICISLNHPIGIILPYISVITGSNCILERNTITGTHTEDHLTELLLEYIKYLIMCPKCTIPETIPKLHGKKKNMYISLCCSACKNETIVHPVNKRISKGIDIIIKYLKLDYTWPLPKGTMVKQINVDLSKSEVNIKEELNPFDIDLI